MNSKKVQNRNVILDSHHAHTLLCIVQTNACRYQVWYPRVSYFIYNVFRFVISNVLCLRIMFALNIFHVLRSFDCNVNTIYALSTIKSLSTTLSSALLPSMDCSLASFCSSPHYPIPKLNIQHIRDL